MRLQPGMAPPMRTAVSLALLLACFCLASWLDGRWNRPRRPARKAVARLLDYEDADACTCEVCAAPVPAARPRRSGEIRLADLPEADRKVIEQIIRETT